ncbi:DUF397 domain-containing protein [Amycolatopsis sp. NPDC059020]|uniref:DUF397 domain-containing protein n=1 Tax=Amycolatopsis sp. NPDC059020 TaxID=3346703 RepID=UPI00366DB244
MTTRRDGWFKSSRSKETTDCVEVKLGNIVGIRDSKDRTHGQLTVNGSAWHALLTTITHN